MLRCFVLSASTSRRLLLIAAFTLAAMETAPGRAADIAYVQGNYFSGAPNSSTGATAVTYTAAQGVGDLNVVVVSWNPGNSLQGNLVQSIYDSKGNNYVMAVGPSYGNGAPVSQSFAQVVYYAKNIVGSPAGGNTVTVVFAVSGGSVGSTELAIPQGQICTGTCPPEVTLRVLEYSGIDSISPLDVAVAASGTSATASSGSLSTTNANDLLIGADYSIPSTTTSVAPYTSRILLPQGLAEDLVVSSTGPYSASASLSTSGGWLMQLVAFRAASAPDTQPPTSPTGLGATPVSTTEIDLSWGASTDNVGVVGYLVERCQGSGCTTFAQVATPTTTTYSDTGLSPSTAYSYRVRATDAVGNLSSYSNVSSVTTNAVPDTQPPTAPTGLSAGAISGSQISLSWTASTDNVGVTGYLIERCLGASCANFAQIATSTETSSTDSGLTSSTTYNYRVRATDAADNLSAYSATASATTNSGAGGTPTTSTYTYDTQGRLQSVVTSSGVTTQYTYDAAGRVISIYTH